MLMFVAHLLSARRGIATTGCVLIAGLAATLPAFAVLTASPLSLASVSDPFASCSIGGPGTNYPNAEVEPFVAVNPTNPSNVIGAYQQDRWSNGGAHGLATSYSTT